MKKATAENPTDPVQLFHTLRNKALHMYTHTYTQIETMLQLRDRANRSCFVFVLYHWKIKRTNSIK